LRTHGARGGYPQAADASDQKLSEKIAQAQKESEAQIGAVATDVTGAKKTSSDAFGPGSHQIQVDRAQGDMGVMSGLIAHNHDDLEELKRRGDRTIMNSRCNGPKRRNAWTCADVPEQNRLEEIQVHPDRTRRRQSIEKKINGGEPVQFT